MRMLCWLIMIAGTILACGADNEQIVKGFEDRFEGGVHLLMSNRLPVVVSVRVNAEMENAKSDIPLPAMFSLPPGAAIHAVTIQQDDRGRRWNMNWRYSFNIGDHRARHDSNFVYAAPFRGRFRITQGWNGKHSHTGAMKYAVDFTMPEGTDVCAARDGVVAQTIGKYKIGGNNPALMSRANTITIVHQDGTIAQYSHLQFGGVKVKVGDRVKAGQIIGLSGNTGFSTQPHLHFAVMKSQFGTNHITLPFRFSQGFPKVNYSYRGRR